jgi:hypothetical protein
MDGVVRGVKNIINDLVADVSATSGYSIEELLPSTGAAGAAAAQVLDLLDPLYAATLRQVMPVVCHLMKPWEASLANADLDGDDAAASPTLSQLIETTLRLLANSHAAYVLGPTVSLLDFALIPPFHALLLTGYALPEEILGSCAAAAVVSRT